MSDPSFEVQAQPTAAPSVPATPRLDDPWYGEPIRLDGVLERKLFAPWLTSVMAFGLAFLVYLIVSNFAALGFLVAEGLNPQEMMEALTVNLREHADSLLLGNAIGQFLGLGLVALLFARWTSTQPLKLLRFRSPDWSLMGLAILGWVAMIPLIQLLGQINQLLPLPDALREFEAMQMAMLEEIFKSDTSIAFNLFVVAVTPAICEEVLFRGYLQRQVERRMSALVAILTIGLVFGLFHLRLTQVLPLSVLGMYLAYLTWRSGSLWPAIIVHFLNNAFAVALSAYVARPDTLSFAELEQVPLPWYVLAAGVAGIVAVLYLQHVRATARLHPSPAG